MVRISGKGKGNDKNKWRVKRHTRRPRMKHKRRGNAEEDTSGQKMTRREKAIRMSSGYRGGKRRREKCHGEGKRESYEGAL